METSARLAVYGDPDAARGLPNKKETLVSQANRSAQHQKQVPTPGPAGSPQGQFDAQAALHALEASDEQGLVTVKWGRTGHQAMVTIEEALGPGTEALYVWACRLTDRPEPAARAVGAGMFRHYWLSRPDEVQARLLRLADDNG